MGRPKRIKFYDEVVTYHVMSKVSGGYFLLKSDFVKQKFLDLLNNLLEAFFFKLEAYAIMSNHFHLLITSCKVSTVSDEVLLKRVEKSKIYKRLVQGEKFSELRKKLGDISEFMKMLKERFSKWFNRVFDRVGYFWGGRFKSVVIEDGKAFRFCKNYIEMNPVRAGIVKNPEDYRFSSAYRKKDKGDKNVKLELDDDLNKNENAFLNKLHLIENGVIFGSFEFVSNIHKKFKNLFNLKKSEKYSTFKVDNKSGRNRFYSYLYRKS